MQLHQTGFQTKQKKAKRVGRGGKRGTFSGRGLKGQKSRAGANLRPGWRDLLKPFPKKRGFKFKSFYAKPIAINVGVLSKEFKDGEVVSFETLFKKGLVAKSGNRMPEIKILSAGDIKKKLSISGCLISKGAKSKIEKAGGIVK